MQNLSEKPKGIHQPEGRSTRSKIMISSFTYRLWLPQVYYAVLFYITFLQTVNNTPLKSALGHVIKLSNAAPKTEDKATLTFT